MSKRVYRDVNSLEFCTEMTNDHRLETQCRFEDMSPVGRLRVHRQPDGDYIVEVVQEDGMSAHVEFTTPMAGGGQSENTWKTLRALMEAMKLDNKKPQHRSMNLNEPSFHNIHQDVQNRLGQMTANRDDMVRLVKVREAERDAAQRQKKIFERALFIVTGHADAEPRESAITQAEQELEQG